MVAENKTRPRRPALEQRFASEVIGRAEAGVAASPRDAGALGSRQPGGADRQTGQIIVDRLLDSPSSRKDEIILIPTDLPIADMGAR